MRKCIAILSIIIVIISSLCICAYAEDITGLQEQSTEITEALNETNNRLQAVQEKLSTNMQQLQELDNQIAQSQEELNTINIQVDELIAQISENEEKLEKTQEEYDKIQGLLDARLIQMYEAPKLQFLQVMLESTSVTDFLSTYYAIKDLAECDKELLETVKKTKSRHRNNKANIGRKEKTSSRK